MTFEEMLTFVRTATEPTIAQLRSLSTSMRRLVSSTTVAPTKRVLDNGFGRVLAQLLTVPEFVGAFIHFLNDFSSAKSLYLKPFGV